MLSTFKQSQRLWFLAIFAVVFIARLSILPKSATEWDSALILQGVENFDVTFSAPHPPGSYLYVLLGRLFQTIGIESLLSMSVMSAVASSLAAAFSFDIGRRIRGPLLGVIAAVAVSANPIMSFYSSIVSTYAFDALNIVLLIWFAVVSKNNRYRYVLAWAALTVGLAAGFRTNAIVFSAPALIFIFWRTKPNLREFFVSAFAGLIGVMVWLIPLACDQPGGIMAWREATSSMFEAARNTTAWHYAPWESTQNNIGRAVSYTIIAIAPFLFLAIAPIVSIFKRKFQLTEVQVAGLITSALLFFPAFVFGALVHWGKSGYVLMYSPAGVIALVILLGGVSRAVLIGSTVATGVVGLLLTVLFTTTNTLFPEKYKDTIVLLSEERYWSPFPETLHRRREMEQQAFDMKKALSNVPLNNADELAVIDGDGGDRVMNVAYYFPNNLINMVDVKGNNHVIAYRRNVYFPVPVPEQIDISPGANLYVVSLTERKDILDEIPYRRADLIAHYGSAYVWKVMPGSEFASIDVVSGEKYSYQNVKELKEGR